MSFNGNEGKEVTLDEASAWTSNYRKTISVGDTLAHFVGKDQLMKILDQAECVGVRYYYGIDEEGAKILIAVGVTSDENDMTEGIIIDRMIACPPRCSTRNSLNS
jgi:hypothetical protein